MNWDDLLQIESVEANYPHNGFREISIRASSSAGVTGEITAGTGVTVSSFERATAINCETFYDPQRDCWVIRNSEGEETHVSAQEDAKVWTNTYLLPASVHNKPAKPKQEPLPINQPRKYNFNQ